MINEERRPGKGASYQPAPSGYRIGHENSTPTYDPVVVARNMPHYEDVYEKLTSDVVMIQAQLATRDKLDPDRVDPITYQEWHDWHRRAVFAHAATAAEKRALKRALTEARALSASLGVTVNGASDFTALCLSFDKTLQRALCQIHAYRQDFPLDEDLDDLVECFVENVTELRGRLASTTNNGEVAS